VKAREYNLGGPGCTVTGRVEFVKVRSLPLESLSCRDPVKSTVIAPGELEFSQSEKLRGEEIATALVWMRLGYSNSKSVCVRLNAVIDPDGGIGLRARD